MAKPPNAMTTAVKFVRRNRYKVSTAVLSLGVSLSWGLFAWQTMATNLQQASTIQDLESDRAILVENLQQASTIQDLDWNLVENLQQASTIQELESERESMLIDTLTDLSAFMSRKADRKLRTIMSAPPTLGRTSLSTSNSDWIA